ncbi:MULTISPECIES: TerB N-terminal domain-containing protein [Aeromonas]|uniref:tellurite resistance TerB family protein n=1 Tax=Aeromonas TaxID=642 RepID=UPI002B0587B0|nr:TerB N-terminal domain-containing protein [Aeromonas jandaei]
MARRRKPKGGTFPLATIVLGFVAVVVVKVWELIQSIPWQIWVVMGCVFASAVGLHFVKTKCSVPATPSMKKSPLATRQKSGASSLPDNPKLKPQIEHSMVNHSPDMPERHIQHQVLTPSSGDLPVVTHPDEQDQSTSSITVTVTAPNMVSQAVAPGKNVAFFDDLISVSRAPRVDMQNEYSIPLPDFDPIHVEDDCILTDKADLEAAGADIRGQWLSPGESITLAGLEITGGMLYVGGYRLPAGLSDEPSLINPLLDVFKGDVNLSTSVDGYWPSYKRLSPRGRKAYLQWLAGGRKDPAANVGYVFLFFYGLERRFLIDLGNDEASKLDVLFIEAEVRRLLSIYGDNYSFKGYASKFLDCINLQDESRNLYELPAPELEYRTYEYPLIIKMCLGQLVRDKKPVPADWALAWVVSIPFISLRTPVERCPDLFRKVFLKLYAERHGEGLRLKELKTRVQLTYTPASEALRGHSIQRSLDLSDVASSTPLTDKLRALLDASTDVIDQYSRYIARNPDKTTALEAQLLLPTYLWHKDISDGFTQLQSDVGSGLATISWGELLAKFNSNGKLNKDQKAKFANALADYQLCIEPSLLASAKSPAPESKMVVYSVTGTQIAAHEEKNSLTAAIGLDLACIVLHSDDSNRSVKADFLAAQIDALKDLHHSQRNRLKAKLVLGVENPPALALVRKQIELLTTDAKSLIARLLVGVVKADGTITPDEVKSLEKMYKLLGLDSQQLYSDLHADDVVVPPSSATINNAPSGAAAPAFALDADRIAKLQAESKSVAAILATVFTEDDHQSAISEVVEHAAQQVPDSAPSASKPEPVGICGLDHEHSSLLRHLLTQPEWARDELVAFATQIGLMLDGALEQINESMLDLYDEMLIEGDDPIEINQDLLEQIPHE